MKISDLWKSAGYAQETVFPIDSAGNQDIAAQAPGWRLLLFQFIRVKNPQSAGRTESAMCFSAIVICGVFIARITRSPAKNV
jgi:hypothetical protein